MNNGQPILEVDLGPNNGVKIFHTSDEIREFVQRQRSAIDWLSGDQASQVQGLAPHIRSRLDPLDQMVHGLTDENFSQIEQLKVRMHEVFVNYRIPVWNSPVARFIDGLRDVDPEVAAAALAAWVGQQVLTTNYFKQFKGAVLMAAFDAQLAPETPSAVRESLQGLQNAFETSRAATESEVRRQLTKFDEQLRLQRRRVARVIMRGKRRGAEFLERAQSEKTQALDSISETNRLYDEHMRIKAPANYWKEKANAHRSNTFNYGAVLITYAILALIAVLLGLYQLATHALQLVADQTPSAIYIVHATMGIVLTTVAFWAGRILTRRYLSEMHLAIDAEERSVMAQTYLALTATGQATDADRAIVLASLFRPTSDGIVKEDGAPDMSPAALLARIGTKP